MEFVWIKDREIKNCNLTFSLDINTPCDTLTLSAVDFYQVYLDKKFYSYGPERTASGYSRKRVVDIKSVKKIEILVSSYGTDSYACDKQLPFFGAELSLNGKVIYNSFDFTCKSTKFRLNNTPKFSSQRGFTEWYDYFNDSEETFSLFPVDRPVLLDGIGDTCKYYSYPLTQTNEGVFTEFDVIKHEDYETLDRHKATSNPLNSDIDFLDKIQNKNYSFIDYELPLEKTGFINLDISARKPCDIYIAFEEILVDDKWIFRRDSCNDFIVLKNVQGKVNFISFEPYALRLLKVIKTGNATINASVIGLENNLAPNPKITSDKKIETIVNSAHNTFIQNAVDLFTDCPGRERAGWLCDSYFMGISENYFTGENKIEKNYLENIILSTTPELPEGMLPKCFPSEHFGGIYIPNWAMWFIVELKSYFSRTNDKVLIEKAKDKVYGVIKFFEKYLNEYGLLENLESWKFIEWSICNSPDYVNGVNFPSNMIYAYALKCAGELYNDKNLTTQAIKMQNAIIKLSYNGQFFVENAIKVDGELQLQSTHLSETCQYYALFTGLIPNEEFKTKMITEFGPLRTADTYKEIGRSNVFIGFYLRFLYLLSANEKQRILDESVDYFYNMASKTGTLWEKDEPSASCNHGFASVIAYIYAKCLEK